MSNNILAAGFQEALQGFAFPGTFKESKPLGHGHINDTFLVTFDDHGYIRKYSMQRMNKHVFPNPEQLMTNLMGISAFLQKKIITAGGNPHREALDFISSRSGKPFFSDSFGEYWRAYRFVDEVYSLDHIESTEEFYESAVAFGHFQYLLSDYPVNSLYEIIPGFHDTVSRFEAFKKAVQEDKKKRVATAEEEIRFYMEHEPVAHLLGDLQKQGLLPLRVTHNDTKSNNILMDIETKKGICVIDLDTVMPGLSVNDFGDSIRFGASTAAEDETDISKVSCDMELYEAYTKGFIKGCNGSLTKEEIRNLPVGAKVMTYECGMRFLTDYLQGDVYFKTAYPTHNLVRSRTQMALVADMEKKWEIMQAIAEKYI